MKKTLWTVQIVLALLFLFAGGSKFVMPLDQLTQGMPAALASGSFIHFIGVCEVLGGLGLVLPGLLRIKPGLTPLAASGLVIIMIGALGSLGEEAARIGGCRQNCLPHIRRDWRGFREL